MVSLSSRNSVPIVVCDESAVSVSGGREQLTALARSLRGVTGFLGIDRGQDVDVELDI